MATIKSYTDLEQSKKLAEILPIESADMCYIQDLLAGCKYGEYKPYIGDLFPAYGQDKIRCWSLAALFGVLPNKIVSHETTFEGEDAEGINDIYHKCIKPTEDGRYTCCYLGNGYKYEYIADNPIDACVAMVEKLNELNLL